jgi:hypothetical protein
MADEFEFDDVGAKWKESLREAHTLLTESKEPEWTEGDAETRKQLVRLVAENRMVALGYVPSSWTYRGTCQKCGVVPLDAPVKETLVGCPWCASKSKPRVYCFV